MGHESTTAPDPTLEVRRELFLTKLADWQETKDPCEHGHVEHTADDHLGRRIVHSFSAGGFGADWDYADVVDFLSGATEIGAAIEAPQKRGGHVAARGADGRVMFFEVRP